ncbi:MAG: DUF2284 domain-containing protein [Ruminococcus sp.]|jgi:predicted metal-binding protein|nr:DUF2284 domain-containing protein [Ruminococcus sp.]
MLSDVKKKYPLIQGKKISADKLIFEERVKMNCFYCGKYNMSWRCPPRIPQIDFKKMMAEYKNAALIYVEMSLSKADYNTVRTDSSVYLHRALLECEKWLYLHNNAMALSFIGGSCKLCKNGCAAERCANPYQSRSSVESLGINVIQSARLFEIPINFPPTEYMTRIGLLLW